MRDFEDSTLWRISAYERYRSETGESGFAPLAGTTGLPSTLHAELSQLMHRHGKQDVLEAVAACMRQHESALLLLRHEGLVWPVTLFPRGNLYHVPRSLPDSLRSGSRDLELLAVEPPGLRPPGDRMHERIADGPGYRPLTPLLWGLALHVPRGVLLDEIGGRAAYRLASDFVDEGTLGGAMGAALTRLRSEIASVQEIARWPGMDADRAARLLNGAYLQGGLVVLRTHRGAQHSQTNNKRLLDWWRGTR